MKRSTPAGGLAGSAMTCLMLGILTAGCSQDGDSIQSAGTERSLAADRTLESNPGSARQVEESDIYKLVGNRLFIQNPTRGLTVVDVSDPDAPVLLSQLGTVVGEAGELYVKADEAYVVFKEGLSVSGQVEVAAVEGLSSTPALAGTLNIQGTLVASRLIGDILYVASSAAVSGQTWITSVSVADPRNMTVLDQRVLTGVGEEVHVTDRTVYVAEELFGDPDNGTRIRLVDISDPGGIVVERGSVDLPGTPRGRFHMDEDGTTFRIVTYNAGPQSTNLFVVDVSNPDSPRRIGAVEDLAPGESLHATRFVGNRAYVVTYGPVIIEREVRGGLLGVGGIALGLLLIDPLWVISLDDPTNPTVLGELIVPGWSDYVFPRGSDRLVAVGRGDLGARVAVSLFDVADPTQPRELRRLEFGNRTASSESNVDFRGVTIVEAGTLGTDAMVTVPYTDHLDVDGNCTQEHHIQLVDLLPDDIVLRGSVQQPSLVRRTFPLGTKLYAIADKILAVIDITNRDTPVNATTLQVGDPNAPEECNPVVLDEPIIVTKVVGCQLVACDGRPTIVAPTFLLFLLLLVLRRRAASQRIG